MNRNGRKGQLKEFIQRNNNLSLQLYFPKVVDLATVSCNDFVVMLPTATPISTTKRLASVLKFTTDLSENEL